MLRAALTEAGADVSQLEYATDLGAPAAGWYVLGHQGRAVDREFLERHFAITAGTFSRFGVGGGVLVSIEECASRTNESPGLTHYVIRT